MEDIPTDEICEKCGRPMVIKSGRYGKFVACSGFPECRNAHPIVKDTGGLCPLCGGHMLLRKSAKGRVYYGCSNYPTCNFMTWDEPVPETCPPLRQNAVQAPRPAVLRQRGLRVCEEYRKDKRGEITHAN